MSEIDDTEKSLRDFAALRQKYAGSTPLRMPGPMRERLRVEIAAMGDCDSVFERKSGFGIGALLRILIPTAAVAAVTVVSFRAWDFDSSTTPASATAAAGLLKEQDKTAEAKQLADANAKSAKDAGSFEAPARQRAVTAAVPLVAASATRTPSSVAAPGRMMAAPETSVLMEEAGFAVALNRDSSALSLENLSAIQAPIVTTAGALPLAEPSSPGYGQPREATLAPTIPVETAKQLNEPVATLRFRSNAPGAILSSFVLRRIGDVVELTDFDGSRYTAAIEMKKLKQGVKADLRDSVEHFTVSGVNQTTGKKVTITGSIFEAPIGFDGRDASVMVPQPRIHAVIQVEGQDGATAIEGVLEK